MYKEIYVFRDDARWNFSIISIGCKVTSNISFLFFLQHLRNIFGTSFSFSEDVGLFFCVFGVFCFLFSQTGLFLCSPWQILKHSMLPWSFLEASLKRMLKKKKRCSSSSNIFQKRLKTSLLEDVFNLFQRLKTSFAHSLTSF